MVTRGINPFILLLSQSGQSLIEHSYKADSDLSPAGWEYAERLRSFLIERRAKCLLERGLNPVGRRLVVSGTFLELKINVRRFFDPPLPSLCRYGHRRVGVQHTRHGHSSHMPPQLGVLFRLTPSLHHLNRSQHHPSCVR